MKYQSSPIVGRYALAVTKRNERKNFRPELEEEFI